MPKVLSDGDIELLQEYRRTLAELNYARGENRISLIVYKSRVEDELKANKLDGFIVEYN